VQAAVAGRADAPAVIADGVRLTGPELALARDPGARRELFAAAERAFARGLPRGVASNGDLARARGDSAAPAPDDDVDRTEPALPLGLAAFLAGAERGAAGGPVARGLLVKLLSASFEPSLTFDRAATAQRRDSAVASVDATRYVVRAGEKIIDAHEVVGARSSRSCGRCAR
jgi:hypothetical protein